MSKKKVAILFTGFIRNWFETCDSFLENVVEFNKDKYDIDIFGVTLDETNRYSGNRNYFEQIKESEFDNLKNKYNMANFEVLENKFLDSYFVKEKNYLFHLIHDYTGLMYKLGGVVKQAYIYQKGLDLIESHNKNYDLVIKTRFDISYKSPCKIPNIIDNEVRMLTMHSNQKFVDAVLVGSYDTMKICLNSYSKLEDIDFMLKNKITFFEDLIRENVIQNNIPIDFLVWKCVLSREHGKKVNFYNEDLIQFLLHHDENNHDL